MRRFIDRYYFTLIFTTLLIMFSLSLTNFFKENLWEYSLLVLVILLSTIVTEYRLNKSHTLKEKSIKFMKSLIPINIVIFAYFIFFVF